MHPTGILPASYESLPTLADAYEWTTLPYLPEASSLALNILRMVQNAHDHKESFNNLANTARKLVQCVAGACRPHHERGELLPSWLITRLGLIVSTLSDVHAFVQTYVKRNTFERFTRRLGFGSSDFKKILYHFRRLGENLTDFKLEADEDTSARMAALKKMEE